MAYIPQPPAISAPHKIALDGRSKLSISGVTDVESFDETLVVLHTSQGILVIRGVGLHMQMLSLEGGQVTVTGTVDSMIYEEESRKGGFFSRLWG